MKDEVQIYKDNHTYTVIINGWKLFTRTYLCYDSDEDIVNQVYQDIYDALKITEEEFNKQFKVM